MRLAYVVNQFPALSETFVSREVRALRALGAEIDAYAFRAPSAADLARMDPETRALAAETEVLGVEPPPLAVLGQAPEAFASNARFRHPSSAWGRVGKAFALARRIAARPPHRMHAHWPYATMVTHLASGLTGVPYSASVHAHEVAHENGHFAECFRRLDWAAFCNRAAMDHLLARLPPEAAAKAHLVYHGVETARFRPLALPERADPFRVLSAGRLTATKGFDRLVRACALARGRGAPVRLAVLGRGDHEGAIRRAAAEAGFADHLELPGWVPHAEVPQWLARSHVFALPASVGFHDGLPNVVLEAMSSARPVVLSPLPAAREAVASGVEGVILDSAEDVEGLARALVRLHASPEALARMAAAARARAARDHDAGALVRRLYALHAA